MREAVIDSSGDERQDPKEAAETSIQSKENTDESSKGDSQKESSDFSDLVLDFINSSSIVGCNGL